MAQFIGDNGNGSSAFDDGFGNRVNVPNEVAQAQGLMPPPSPIVDPFAGGPQIQASPMPPQGMPPQAMGGEPMGAPMPMGPGADANMAAMNPPALPEPVPQAPAAPVKPGKPLTVKQEAAAAQALTDQSMSMATGAMDRAAKATTDQAAIDSQMHTAIADETAKREYDLGVMRQKHEGEKMQAEQEKSTLRNGITQAVDARKSWKMDRGRLLKQMDGGDKTLGLLSMILGAFAQTMNKGQSNPAMDVLMKRIDQDADDQRQEYDQLGENVGEAKSSYKEYLDQLGDKDAAFAATKAERIDSYKSQLEMLAARSSSERVKTQAALAIADLDTKKAGIIGQAADSAHARVHQRRQLQEQAANRAEGRRQFDIGRLDRLAAEQKAAMAAGDTAKVAQLAEERKLGIGDLTGSPVKNKDGTSFLARSPESAIEIAKQAAATYGIATLASQLEDGYKKHGSEFTKTEAYRQLQSTHAQMQIELKEAFKLGVLAGPDLELINRAIGTSDPTELRSYTKALRGLADNSVGRLETRMKADGFTGRLNVPTASSMTAAEDTEYRPMFDTVASREEKGTRRPASMSAFEALSSAEGQRSRDIASGKALSRDAQAALDSAVARIQSPKASAAEKRSAAEALRTVVANKDYPMAARQYAEQGMRAYTEWEK